MTRDWLILVGTRGKKGENYKQYSTQAPLRSDVLTKAREVAETSDMLGS
jgi:hypothetical protein